MPAHKDDDGPSLKVDGSRKCKYKVFELIIYSLVVFLLFYTVIFDIECLKMSIHVQSGERSPNF